jgi:hypothetical protein
MAYITTDFWANYDRIWLQPMYYLVTAWNQNAPATNRLRRADDTLAGPIFSVGPHSAFYSPYWQVIYVEVPPGTPPTKYTAARQLFDDRLIMHPGPNRFASIGPSDAAPSPALPPLALPSAADIELLVPDIENYLVDGESALAAVVASAQALTGWLDGAAVSYVDFGTDNFDADANRVIQDIPLFLFVRPDATGTPMPLGAPNVGGVAPLFSQLPARVTPSHRPQFGALWRLYFVAVPGTAAMLTTDVAAPLMTDAASEAAVSPMIRRVALDKSCFDDVAAFSGCVWLDSQQAIESRLGPRAITRTALQPACPFVMFAGYPVPAQ